MAGLPAAGLDRLTPAQGAFYIYADVSHLTNDSRDFCKRMLRGGGRGDDARSRFRSGARGGDAAHLLCRFDVGDGGCGSTPETVEAHVIPL